MTIKRFEAFEDNYIWAIESENNYLIVDPGDSKPIIEFFQTHADAKLAGILITHHHHDHVGGIKKLTDSVNNYFFAPNQIKFNKPNKTNVIPIIGPVGFEKYGVNTPVHEGNCFKLGFKTFKVLEIPGHTSDHIGYLCKNSNKDEGMSIFCGDTLFAAGCGKLLGGKASELFTSLIRLAKLPENTSIYCAHEYTLNNIRFASQLFPNDVEIQMRKLRIESSRLIGLATVPSTILEEKKTNPFFRCKNIKEFAQMRTAKDNWSSN